MPLEVKMELENTTIEPSLEAVTFRHFPLLVDNREGDIFVGYSGAEANRHRVCCAIWLQIKLRCSCFISQIRIEDVELVALDDFRGRVL